MSVIYTPKGRAREYSPLALNPYTQCANGCDYCYAPSCLQKPREEYFCDAPVPRKGIIAALEKELGKSAPKQQVLMSFVGDPYGKSADENVVTNNALQLLLQYNVPVAILTKSGKRCLVDKRLFQRFGDRIQVGASLTFKSELDRDEYEPGAARAAERLETLKALHNAGIKTFASFEPVIDPVQSLQLMRDSLDFVDTYKVGKINNYKGLDKKIDWTAFLTNALAILREAGKQIYIKKDLREAAPSVELWPEEIDMDLWNVGEREVHNAP